MRVFLEKGHGMTASMKLDPYVVRVDRDPDIVPASKREWELTVLGTGDEALALHGSLKEMRGIASMMTEGVGMMQEQSWDGGTADTPVLGPYIEAVYDEDAPEPGRPIRLAVNGGRSYMLTKGDAERLWYSLTSAIGRCC